MDTFPCHECGAPVDDATITWRTGDDHRVDEAAGEPYCPGCAGPLPLAA